jgi:hypothetical protein
MKTILLFLASVTLSFAQNPELFSNEWHLDKMVVDDVDYPSPTAHNHTIYLETPINENSITSSLISLIYCTDYFGFLGNITDDTIVNEMGFFFNPDNDNCIFSSSDFNYLADVYMFFQNEGIINYVINEVDNYKQLVLTNSQNNKLYYNNVNLSHDDFLFNNSISFYPNPAQDIINIDMGIHEIKNVKIYAMDGKLVGHLTLINQTIDISHLNQGIYILEFNTSQYEKIRKQLVKN